MTRLKLNHAVDDKYKKMTKFVMFCLSARKPDRVSSGSVFCYSESLTGLIESSVVRLTIVKSYLTLFVSPICWSTERAYSTLPLLSRNLGPSGSLRMSAMEMAARDTLYDCK